MKKINIIFAMAAMAAAFASCNKNSVASQQGTTLSLTAGTETKTILRNGTDVCWSKDDQLAVFDTDGSNFIFETEQAYSGKKEAVFTCNDWTGKTPVMAVHSYSKDLSKNNINGSVITTKLHSAQQIYNKESYSKYAALSVGKITENGGSYSIETMKNCFALLKFTLIDTSVVSVTLKGNNDEVIAGWVDVDYDALTAGNPFWTENTTKGGDKSITATVSGVFDNNSTYYFSVLPQTLSKGLTLVMTRKDDKIATREIKSSVTLERGKIKTFAEAIDKDLTYKLGDIVLDCTHAGNFRYDNGGTPTALPTRNTGTFDGDFWLIGKESFKFNGPAKNWSSYLNAKKGNTIKMPNISGYVLQEFHITSQKASNDREYCIFKNATDTLVKAQKWTVGTTKEIKFDLSGTTPGDRYIACDSELGIQFKLTYTAVSE